MASTSVEILKSVTPRSIPSARPESRGLRVCMVAYAFYESDTRILQYATALAKRGDTVDVIALQRDDSLPEFEVLNGVNVYRIQSRTVNEKGLFSYGSSNSTLPAAFHCYFCAGNIVNVPTILCMCTMCRTSWCSPRSFLKWKGVPVILDIHDLLAGVLRQQVQGQSRLPCCSGCNAGGALFCRFCHHVIIANHLWRDRLVARSSRPDKCSVVRNHPDLDIFVEQSGHGRKNDKFMLTYPGSLNAHQGLDVAIRAFARIADQMPDAEFHIYGEGRPSPSLIELANKLGMQERILFHDFLPSREIARVMASNRSGD